MASTSEANETWDESQIIQVRECLATLSESIGSPVQHDVSSMDNSHSMGFRSPSMNTLAGQPVSPGPGRSLREHEEQMSALRKENFNLKLRIYFLEEHAGIKAVAPCNLSSGSSGGNSTAISHYSPPDGAASQENLFKQNIDLKVEVESLRKDLQEKQDLIYKAANSWEVVEEGHRKAISEKEQQIEKLEQDIKQMEAADRHHQQQLLLLQSDQTRTGLNDSNLLDFLEKMEHREVNVVEKVQTMEQDNVIRQLREQNDLLSQQINDLHREMEEKEHKIKALEQELGEVRFECAELKDKLEKNDTSSVDAEVTRLKKDLFATKSELADKLCQLDDTEVKLKAKTTELFKTAKMAEKLVMTITDQEKELSQLKRCLATADPTNAANRSSAVANAPTVVDQDHRIVSQEEYDSMCMRLKAIQKKNDSLIQKLTGGSSNDRNENIIIKQLNEEVMQAREEAEKAQRWRKECVDLCAISTARLEELAGFLDSLLKNKELCGSISVDRRKAIRKAVDRSLDLSRSLNMSISVTGFSLPENSFASLSCLSNFLNGSDNYSLVEHEDAEKENRVNDQPIGSAEKVIEGLKAENRELRGQLEGRVGGKKGHTETRRKLIPLIAEPLSDSEAWSEPDRGVSLARIGLEERSPLKNSASKGKQPPRVLQELSSTSENEGNSSQLRKQSAELKQLQEAIQEKDSRILDIQTRMVDLDNKLQEEKMMASRTQVELENTRHVNQRLEKDNNEQASRIRNNEKRLEELQREIQQKNECIEKLKKDRDQACVDLRVAVMKQETLKTEYQDSQQKHKAQVESLLTNERQRLEDLRRELIESFNVEMQAKQASFEACLTESYISKNIYLEKMNELDELHFRLEDAHLNLLNLSENESKLKQQVKEAEKSIQAMRKTLDETTLQASKAALERSKAMNEKRLLEDELQHVRLDLDTVKAEKNDLNTKLVEAQSRLQQCQRSPPARLDSYTGYSSEELLVANRSTATVEQAERQNNSSPDLGIESDAGRLSNPESIPKKLPDTASPARPLLKTLELTKSMSNLLVVPKEEAKSELNTSATAVESGDSKTVVHDCVKIETDFAELKRRYKQTRRHLELAYDSIKSSNKRKEQVERDIKQQIQKTNVVLKTVRTNMTTELEKSSAGSALSVSSESGGRKS